MRLWTIHPKLLDTKGICGLWRESIMAKNAINNLKHGYKGHPQLIRFLNSSAPDLYINEYLREIYDLSLTKNNLNFSHKYIEDPNNLPKIKTSLGQLIFEFKHLYKKLFERKQFDLVLDIGDILSEIDNIINLDINNDDKNQIILKNDYIHRIFYIDFNNKNIENWEKL